MKKEVDDIAFFSKAFYFTLHFLGIVVLLIYKTPL